jgi:serine/threonine protein kinase
MVSKTKQMGRSRRPIHWLFMSNIFLHLILGVQAMYGMTTSLQDAITPGCHVVFTLTMSLAMASAIWTTAIAVELNSELYPDRRTLEAGSRCHLVVWTLVVAVGVFVGIDVSDPAAYHYYGCGTQGVTNTVVLAVMAPAIFAINVAVSLAFWIKARQMYPMEAKSWLRKKAFRSSAVFVYLIAWSPAVATAIQRACGNYLDDSLPRGWQAFGLSVFGLQGFFNCVAFIASQRSLPLGIHGTSAEDDGTERDSLLKHMPRDGVPLKFIRFSELKFDKVVLGEGGSGIVKRAMWQGKAVAVKALSLVTLLSPAEVEVLKKEALLMSLLYHPNLASIYGIAVTTTDTSEIDIYVTKCTSIQLVLEIGERGSCMDIGLDLGFSKSHHFFFGDDDGAAQGSVSSELSNDGIVRYDSPEQNRFTQLKLAVVQGIARGMRYLHTCRPPIAHRDLKPGNVFVREDWTVQVGDFGLSKLVSGKLGTVGFQGTLLYSSANAISGELSPLADDVWCFGMVLYHLWEGFAPFYGEVTRPFKHDDPSVVERHSMMAQPNSSATSTVLALDSAGAVCIVPAAALSSPTTTPTGHTGLPPGSWSTDYNATASSAVMEGISTTGLAPRPPQKAMDMRKIIMDGWRPQFTEITPTWVAELAYSCWQSEPARRPTMAAVVDVLTDRGTSSSSSTPASTHE